MIGYLGYSGHTLTDIEWLLFLARMDITNSLPSICETITRTGHVPAQGELGLCIGYEGMSSKMPSDPTRMSPCISISLVNAPESNLGQSQYTDVGAITKGLLAVTVYFKNMSSFRFGLHNRRNLSDTFTPSFPQTRTLTPEQVEVLRTKMGISRVPHYLVLERTIEELKYKRWDIVDEIWARASMQGGNIWEAIKNVVDVIEKEWRELCNEGAVLYRLMIDEPCKQ